MSDLVAKEYRCVEEIKQVRPDGSEYWCARDLAFVLDYNKWENFHKVIKRAMIACENSGREVICDFPEVRKIVSAGATTKPVLDYELSRYACYLIVQNGDPRKEVIALPPGMQASLQLTSLPFSRTQAIWDSMVE